MLEPMLPLEVPRPLDRELLAWAAGFFDGEGTTIAKRERARPGYCQLQLSVPQAGAKDVPEVLERFRTAVLGTGRVDRRKTLGIYAWRPRGRADSQLTLALLWPYLGTVKREQAATAVSTVAEQYATGRCAQRKPKLVPTLTPHPPADIVAPGTNTLERAWAAGFLDAEGSFGLVHGAKRKHGPDWYRIRVSADQHSSTGGVPEVLTRLRAVVGVGRIERHGEPDDYKWVVEGRAGVLHVLARTECWLGSVKLAQAEEALARFDAQQRFRSSSSTRCLRGHEYDRLVVLPSGKVRKYCNACARLLARRSRARHGSTPRQFKNVARRYLE